jgi:hypothetical protein
MTIMDTVKDNEELLKPMDCSALTAWEKENGMDSRAGFSRFKKALKEIGINYDALRHSAREKKTAERESLTLRAHRHKFGHSRCLFRDEVKTTNQDRDDGRIPGTIDERESLSLLVWG